MSAQLTPSQMFQNASDELGKLTNILTEQVASTNERLDYLETKMNRPDDPGDGSFGRQSEKVRAFDTYLRRGIERVPSHYQDALQTGEDPAGGFLNPAEYEKQLERDLTLFSPIRSVARVGTTGSGEVLLPKRTSPLTGYWVNELEGRTASQPAFGLTSVPLGEIACFTDVSTRQIEDSAFNIGSELISDFSEAFASVESAAFINGDGTKQRPEGILRAPGITTVPSGAATSVTADALLTLLFSLPNFWRSRATFALNSSTLATIAKLKDSSGAYLLQPGLQAGQPSKLLGLNFIECVDLPDLSAGSKSIVLGDWSRYRIFGKPNSTQVLRDPFSQATNGIVRFHARRRVGATLTMPSAFRIMTTGT